MSPFPTAAKKAFTLVILRFFIISVSISSGNSSFQFFSRRSSSSRPVEASFCSPSLRACLIFWRAFVVTTKLTQSGAGRWFFAVRISTTSPVWSFSLMGTGFPPTLPPTQRVPILVWMLKAKSSTVAPAGRIRSSPVGVNTKISRDGGCGRSSGPSVSGCSRA